MSFDPTNAAWVKTGCTASVAGTLTEDSSTNNRHSFYQDIQPIIDDGGFGSSAVYKARVEPFNRTICWLSARENNSFYTAWFQLTGAGTVLTTGANVSSASIELVPGGGGAYDIKVVYNGTYSSVNTRFAIGSAETDGELSHNGNSQAAIQVTRAQLIRGTQDYAYEATTDRATYLDLQTSDGSQNATIDGTDPPQAIDPLFCAFGSNLGFTINDFAFDRDDFTAIVVLDWNGTTGATSFSTGQWDGASQNSWLMSLDTNGKFTVSISDDGTNVDKTYAATDALDANETFMLTFTWDGTTLRLYINDIELTGAELTKTTDNAASGNLHDSTEDVVVGDLGQGNLREFRMYDVAKSAAEVASIAAEFSLSGLPDGSGPPPGPGGGDVPTTVQEMIDVLVAKGVSTNDIFYADAAAAAGGDGSSGSPWDSVQTAASNLTAGQAVICSGRFEETVTLRASGSAGNLIWFAGDPTDPCIIDGSQSFSETWTDQGSNRWRAPYNLTRTYIRNSAYHDDNCGTSPPCIHESHAAGHTMICNDVMLERINQGTVPATMAAGTCHFEQGTGSIATPQYVWVRLSDSTNPNDAGNVMRTSRQNSVTGTNPSGGQHLFDWHSDSPGSLWNGQTGGDGATKATGRNFIGLLNMHFRHSVDLPRKNGGCAFRGQGWYAEWCSWTEMNAYGLALYGYDHTIINCKISHCGQGTWRAEYLQNDGHPGTTRIEACLFEDSNVHLYPIAWEAGQKFSECGNGGKVEIVDCLFYNNNGAGLWWDIRNGPANPADDAFLVERCIFDNVTRWGAFLENNCYHVTIRHCGFFETVEVEAGGARLGTPQNAVQGNAISISGSGKAVITQNAFVENDGPGHYGKVEGPGASQGQNQNVITNNVYVNNGESTTIATFTQACYIGGDSSTENQTTSTIDGNVFTQGTAPDMWIRNQQGNYSTRTSTLATWESWHGGTGNAIEATATNVVASTTNRKTFFDTSGGNYPTRGPQSLVHYEDLPTTGWSIP